MNSIEDTEMFIAYEEENVYRIYTGLHYDEDSKPIKEKFDKKKIEVKETIKNIGRFTINIKLYEGVNAKLTVNIIAE